MGVAEAVKLGLIVGVILLLLALELKTPLLGAVALMVWTGTLSSVRAELARLALASATVEQAMLRQFMVLSPGDTLGKAAEEAWPQVNTISLSFRAKRYWAYSTEEPFFKDSQGDREKRTSLVKWRVRLHGRKRRIPWRPSSPEFERVLACRF